MVVISSPPPISNNSSSVSGVKRFFKKKFSITESFVQNESNELEVCPSL